MELNPTLLSKSMHVQLQTLIVDAFQYLSPLPQRSYLVIIDGLDECHDKATQQLILRLIPMRNDHSSSITAPIFNWKSP